MLKQFFQEKDLLDVINLEYRHRCRAEPVEAAIYSLEAKGEELEMFRANASAELTVELGEATRQQTQRKQKHTSLELPLYFTKEYLGKVWHVTFGWNLLTGNSAKYWRYTLLHLTKKFPFLSS